MPTVNLSVNGIRREIAYAEEKARLTDILRDHLELTGTKVGCGVGKCGSCTVVMNGKVVTACTVLAKRAEGADVLTIEGLSNGSGLHPIQQAFVDAGAIQCGFCTPGFVLRTYALLQEIPNPTDDEIIEALQKNLCRCTGYEAIVEGANLAAQRL